MRKFLSLSGRALGRITRPLLDIQRKTRLLAWILSVLGLAVAWNQRWDKVVLPWLNADWSHWATLILALILLGSIIALYGAEKELDSKRIVQIKVNSIMPELHLNFPSKPKPGPAGTGAIQDRYNIFSLRVKIGFRNDTEHTTRAYFPKVEILRKERWRKWVPVPLTKVDSNNFRTHPRDLPGLMNSYSHWYPDKKYEINALEDSVGEFYIVTHVSDDIIPRLLEAPLRLRFFIDIVGPGITVLERDIPTIKPIQHLPSAGPTNSKVSE